MGVRTGGGPTALMHGKHAQMGLGSAAFSAACEIQEEAHKTEPEEATIVTKDTRNQWGERTQVVQA
eukprot:6197432-Pleurochrysis_carterae.AAC.3